MATLLDDQDADVSVYDISNTVNVSCFFSIKEFMNIVNTLLNDERVDDLQRLTAPNVCLLLYIGINVTIVV